MKPRRIAVAVAVALLITVAIVSMRPHYLATSADGRTHFINVQYQSGTNGADTLFLSSGPEAFVRDALFWVGFRSVEKTRRHGMPPPDVHMFALQYSGPFGDLEESIQPNGTSSSSPIQAEVVQPDGTTHKLYPLGHTTFGLEKRKYAFWVLNDESLRVDAKTRLKVYLPADSPTVLPLPK